MGDLDARRFASPVRPLALTNPTHRRYPHDRSPAYPEPTIFILYGGTGDLAHRSSCPPFRLAIAAFFLPEWRLVGNGRGDVSGGFAACP